MVRRTKRFRMRTRRRRTRKTRVPRLRMKYSRPARRVKRNSLSGSKARRWQKVSMERQTDFTYYNVSLPVAGAEIQAVSSYSPVMAVPNMVTPLIIDSTAPVAPGSTNFTAAFQFKLSNLYNVSEWISSSAPPSGLFEEYRIKKVCIEIVPVYAGKQVKGRDIFKSDPADDDGYEIEYEYPTPTMYYYTDHDSTNPINWPMISEQSGVKRIKLNKRHRIWVDPKVVMPVGGSSGGGSVWASYKTAPWITNKNIDVVHYGLRFLMQDWPGPADQASLPEGTTTSAVPFQVRFNIRYFLEFRGIC